MSYIGNSSSTQTATPTDGSVTTPKIVNGAITPAKLSTGAPTWDSAGNVGIGTGASIGGKLDVVGADDTAMYFRNATANIRLRPYVTSYATSQLSALNAAGNAYAPLAIGGSYTVLETNGTERVRIESSGTFLVGCTAVPNVGATPQQFGFSSSSTEVVIAKNTNSSALYIKNVGGASATAVSFWNGVTLAGRIETTTSATTSYLTSSDYRLKENIQPMQNGLEFCRKQRPVTYAWKVDGSKGSGYIAHWLQEDGAGNCVSGEKDAVDKDGNPVYQCIDTSFMVGPLNAGLNELADIVDRQAKLIETLTSRLTAAEEQILALGVK